MQLGINLGYWGAGMDGDNLAVAQEADRLGFSVCWAAEAYGSDAATVLSWVAAQTERIDVGSAIFQIPARQPAMTAMTAATLDSLSGGRFRLGLGVSGPQVSEGWYGVKFDKPLARTREYVEIVRKAMSRERLTHEGAHWTLPLPGGPGKPLALGEDVRALADQFRPYTALYVGGMGSAKQNFYNQLAQRMGYEKAAAEIQDKYLSGDKQGAAAAVPQDLIDKTTLLGSVER